jgi:hypothetical protein
MKKLFCLLSLICTTLVLTAPTAHSASGLTATSSTPFFPDIQITTSLLTAAGFTNTTPKTPHQNQYTLPVHYFQVDETLSPQNSTVWGSAANLVAISIQPIENRKWVFNQGDMLVTETNGRFQASVSSPGNFIVVTGPDRTKVMTLTQNLKVLY